MKNKKLLSQMSVEDKIVLSCGADFWDSVALERYGIPAMSVADGPHGLRYQTKDKDMLGTLGSDPATCFPTAAATACSWDRALLGAIGEAITDEALAYGVDTVLGPGLNIKRNPLCGRNFEYFSEDPCLSGQLGAAYVRQAQQKGVGTCLKHFAANSQEYKRFSSDSIMDERTLREIYLSAFETAVKDGAPAMVMCAYNKLNGTYCSDNRRLLTDILREEWGFSGMVVTDWGAMHDRVAGFKAGCDWSMPGGSSHLQRYALEAYRRGELTEDEIDTCVDRIITRVMESVEARKKKQDFDKEKHHKLARRAAAESAVLLKNEGVLPLKSDRVALIGQMARQMRYQGSGSSHINPTRLVSVCDAVPGWAYAPGCDDKGATSEALLAEAEAAAKNAETAVVVAGLPPNAESEGYDREHMRMPEGHIRLIERVTRANPNTVVVLLCGSPVELPWLDAVKAVLYMGLPGQAGGEAIVDVLTGKHNPGGKLAETWPLRYENVPSALFYGSPNRDAQYREGIYVGYRYYETAGVPVRFPFGFGLSYTRFEYSQLRVRDGAASVTVTNTGEVPGSEIVQLYVAPPAGGIHRPARELKGFCKVFLQPGERQTVTIPLDERAYAIWNDGWQVPAGEYELQLGASCRDIRLTETVRVAGDALAIPGWQAGSWYEKPAGQPSQANFEALLGRKLPVPAPLCRGSFTMENTIHEMAGHSLVMRIMRRIMAKTIAKMNGGKIDFSNSDFRMSYTSSVDSALFSLCIASGGTMPENIARGMLDIANGHLLRGLRRMGKREQRP